MSGDTGELFEEAGALPDCCSANMADASSFVILIFSVLLADRYIVLAKKNSTPLISIICCIATEKSLLE